MQQRFCYGLIIMKLNTIKIKINFVTTYISCSLKATLLCVYTKHYINIVETRKLFLSVFFCFFFIQK